MAFKLGDYFVKPTDNQASDSLQAGAPVQTDAPQITNTPQPVISVENPENTVAEITDLPSDTSIFGVTTTLPIPDTTYNIIYTPNPNNGYTPNNTTTTQEVVTSAPTTEKPTKAEPTIENVGDDEW